MPAGRVNQSQGPAEKQIEHVDDHPFPARSFGENGKIQHLRVHRRDREIVFLEETGRFGFAGRDAQSAADAAIRIHPENSAILNHRLHLAALDANAASRAGGGVDAGTIVCGKESRGPGLLFGRGQNPAAAAAADTDDVGLFRVSGLQHHSLFFSHVQERKALLFRYPPGAAARRVAGFPDEHANLIGIGPTAGLSDQGFALLADTVRHIQRLSGMRDEVPHVVVRIDNVFG